MKKHFIYWLTLVLGNILLAALLTACSFNIADINGVTATPTPVKFIVFKGNDFSISYPQNWTYKKDSDGQVTFSNADGSAALIAGAVAAPNGTTSTASAVDAGMSSFKSSDKNYKDEKVPATVKIAGNTWDQRAATGDDTENGVTTNLKIYVIATQYPEKKSNTKLFIISYVTTTDVFNQTNTDVFQPMLNSFKFNAA
jgi:hypothetical protein